MDKGQLLELIRDVPFFRNFTLEDQDYLASTDSEVVRYRPNESIINEGDTDSALHILLRGEVAVTKNSLSLDHTKKTRRITVAKLHSGSVFGEVCLISKRPRTSGVHAIGEVITLRMDGGLLEKIHPVFKNKIQTQLIDLLVKRLDDMNSQMAGLR